MTSHTNEYPDTVILGEVRNDGTPDTAQVLFRFPVPHQQMRVRQQVKIDAVEIPGRSGKVKQAVGYEDAEIEIRIVLVDEEEPHWTVRSAIEQLRALQTAFRQKGAQALPRVFSISSRLTDACQIKTVLFQGIDVGDTTGNNDLDATLQFIEFEPIELQVERQALETKIATTASEQAAAQSDALDDEIGADEEQNQLLQAFRSGRAEAMGGAYDGELPGEDTEP